MFYILVALPGPRRSAARYTPSLMSINLNIFEFALTAGEYRRNQAIDEQIKPPRGNICVHLVLHDGVRVISTPTIFLSLFVMSRELLGWTGLNGMELFGRKRMEISRVLGAYIRPFLSLP